MRSTTTIRRSIDRLVSDGVLDQIDVRSDDNHHRHAWRYLTSEGGTSSDGNAISLAPRPQALSSLEERVLKSLRASDVEILLRADRQRFAQTGELAGSAHGNAVLLLVRRQPNLFVAHAELPDSYRLSAFGHAVQLLARSIS